MPSGGVILGIVPLLIGAGAVVAMGSAIAGGSLARRRRKTVIPWGLAYDGVAWRATNQTTEDTLEIRVRIDGVDTRGIGLREEITIGVGESMTFSKEPGAQPEFDEAGAARSTHHAEAQVEISWKYEYGGRRYYWSNDSDRSREYYWSRGPGGSWG